MSPKHTIRTSSDHQPAATPPSPPMALKPRTLQGRATAACGFRMPARRAKFQPEDLIRRLGDKLARAIRMVRKQRSSCKVSSSAAAALVRSRSCADPITDNSHRAEAIEDCIEFLNSSSLQRSNSVASKCA